MCFGSVVFFFFFVFVFVLFYFVFFFNDTATTEIYTLSLHDALPIWQYVEDIITPTSDDDSLGANKRFWGLFKHLKTDSNGVPPLKHQGNLISNAAGKATVLNSYFQSVFTSHKPLDLKQLCQKTGR